jgi:hypothetical protein
VHNLSNRSVIKLEISRNLRRNPFLALRVVVVTAIGFGISGLVAEWFILVGRAYAVTDGTRADLGVVPEREIRTPVLLCAVVATELVVVLVSEQALGRRQRSEISFLRRELGLPRCYGLVPVLCEGAILGLVGGGLAAAVAILGKSLLASYERSTVPASFATTTRQGNRVTSTSLRFQLGAIHVGTWELAFIAVSLAVFSTLLGTINTIVRVRRHLS